MLHVRSTVRVGFAAVIVAALAGVAAVEASTTASIDRFVITRAPSGGTLALFYDDPFGNGAPPVHLVAEPMVLGAGAYAGPTGAPGLPGTYVVSGTFPAGAEAGDRLALDPNAGQQVFSANGLEFLRIGATLASDTTPGELPGLKPFYDFSVRARFDLVTPLANLDGYGLELNDTSPGSAGNDRLQFMARRDANGAGVIQLIDQRFGAGGGVTFLATVPLAPPQGATQFSMFLDHLAASAGVVSASFYYVNAAGNVYDPIAQMFTNVPATNAALAAQYRTILATPGQIFKDNEGFVRGGFFAVQAIPEPGTYAMLLAGLGILGWVARRRLTR